MRANRRRDTEPERRVRSLLHADGLRFRVDLPVRLNGSRPIRPDIVFTRTRLAIFIDGCFWHGCPVHGQRPNVRNSYYWAPKIAGNIERGRRHTEALADAGWLVFRFWEHEPPVAAAGRIRRAHLDRLRRLYGKAREPVTKTDNPPLLEKLLQPARSVPQLRLVEAVHDRERRETNVNHGVE